MANSVEKRRYGTKIWHVGNEGGRFYVNMADEAWTLSSLYSYRTKDPS